MAQLDETLTEGQLGHVEDHEQLHAKANYIFDVMDYGAVGDGLADDAAVIQLAIDAAESTSPTGTVYFPAKNFVIDTGVIFLDCDVHAERGATLTVGTGVAAGITVGSSSTSCDYHDLRLPNVKRVSRDWNSTPTINTARGVLFAAADSCNVYVGQIRDFSYGLVIEGDTNGVAYNTFVLSAHIDNAINIFFDAINAGWSNQNTFIGGRNEHSNIGGSPPYAGVVNLKMDAGNNNTFVGVSFEGGYEEFLLDCDGSNNTWLNCRWEVDGNPNVRWGANSQFNYIIGGYDSADISSTSLSGARDNSIVGNVKWLYESGESTDGGIVNLQNSSSDGRLLYMYPLGEPLLSRDLDADYEVRIASGTSGYKASGDTEERIYFNHRTGRLHFGDGSTNITTLPSIRYNAGFHEFSGPIRIEGSGKIYSGSGTPEGSQAATIGSLYLRTDGGGGTSFYVKETGSGTTGWVAK